MKLKKGDQIVVIIGKDKGRRGKIEEIFPKKMKVLVPGINIYKRHTKSRGKERPGGIIEKTLPLPISNLALVCPKCNKPTRVGYLVSKDGIKARICRKCQSAI